MRRKKLNEQKEKEDEEENELNPIPLQKPSKIYFQTVPKY